MKNLKEVFEENFDKYQNIIKSFKASKIFYLVSAEPFSAKYMIKDTPFRVHISLRNDGQLSLKWEVIYWDLGIDIHHVLTGEQVFLSLPESIKGEAVFYLDVFSQNSTK